MVNSAIGLEEFDITRNDDGKITELRCPQGEPAEVRDGRVAGRYSAGFDGTLCEGCPLMERCPAKRLKKRNLFTYRFTDTDVRVAQQRRQLAESGKEAVNIRASVESTVRSVIHPFGGHDLEHFIGLSSWANGADDFCFTHYAHPGLSFKVSKIFSYNI